MAVPQWIADKLARLERATAAAVEAQERPWREHYSKNYRYHHLAEARRLAPPPEIVPVEAEVRMARQIEREREVAAAESSVGAVQERAVAWQAKRREIMAERARLKREADEQGRDFVFATPEPPNSPPDWFEAPRDGQVTHHRPAQSQRQQRNADGTRTLALPGWDAVAGRPANRGPELLHPEEQLRRQAAAKEKQR